MESDDPQRRQRRRHQLEGGRFLIPAGSRHASALGLRRRINRRAPDPEVTGSRVTINNIHMKINRSKFNAGRGINLSPTAGVPHPPAIREEWQDEDSDRVATVTDLHRRISNESDIDPWFDVDESRFNNLNPHSMLLMHEATVHGLHNRVSTLESQLEDSISNTDMMNRTIRELRIRVSTLETQREHATGAIGNDKKLTDGEMCLILLRKYYPPIILFR